MGKHLGQHFLTSRAIARQIVAASRITPKSAVLEIGAGKGMLTAELVKVAGSVIAVEKDPRCANFLASAIQTPGVCIVKGDIRDLLCDEVFQKKLGATYHVVANIPYYLTAYLFRVLLQEMPRQPQSVTLLIQKEVAARVCAQAPHANLLALAVQVYGTPRIVRNVSRRYFSPQPRVDSSILHISNMSKIFFKQARVSEAAFFKLLGAGFSHPRKQLKNNLHAFFKTGVPDALRACGIAALARAENVALEQWACLVKAKE